MERKKILPAATAALIGFTLLVVTTTAAREAATNAVAILASLSASPGDIVINEVCWMGTAANYADEWIELYNTTAQPITLTGWTLVADDGTPAISLIGVIAADSYFLLERSDDNTISDISADQIFLGSLENDPAAETLRLRDETDALIDTVNGDGGAWPAGDNYTKQTMERRDPLLPGDDGNWASNDGVRRNGLDADGNPVNGTPRTRNSAYVTPLPPAADLAVSKTGPASTSAGGYITYALRLTNAGTLTATRVRLTDQLPSPVTFITASTAVSLFHDDGLLVWTTSELPADSSPISITITGFVSETITGVLRNVVTSTTATTETVLTNNHATWETVVGGEQPAVLINSLLYDGYQLDDRDEAVQLMNVAGTPIDVSGWRLCDEVEGGSCAIIPSGTLNVSEAPWLAYWGSDFSTSMGFYPAYAVNGLISGTQALGGSWPRYANTGEQVVLQNDEGKVVDTLVYGQGNIEIRGWNGPAVEPWSGREGFRTTGQILYRRVDEMTGMAIPDSNTAADWAQYADDPIYGRRVRYPGWDLEPFFHPFRAIEESQLTIGVAPDNAAEVVLDAINSARSQIEIGIYSLNQPTIIQKLIQKANYGVTVTILFEGDQAGVSKSDPRWYQQMWACQELVRSGNGTCWFMINDDEERIFDRYRFMHAKYMLIDRQKLLITSQNFTARGMPDDDLTNGTYGSRGVVLLSDATSVVAQLASVFDHDLDPAYHVDLLQWSPTDSEYGAPPPDFTPTLTPTDYTTYTVVFSEPLAVDGRFGFELLTAPEAALRQSDGILGLVNKAGPGDRVYVEMLDERAHWGEDPSNDPNPRMVSYIAAARRGARVRILLNKGEFEADYYDASQNLTAVQYANSVAHQEGLDLRAALGDPTEFGIHNKMILVWLEQEGGYVHLGSLNGSETSNKVNREVALQIQSDEVYAYLKKVFEWDWYASNPTYFPVMIVGWSRPAPPVEYPLISEVLYDPAGADEGDEWVEIFNPTPHAIDITGWRLGDAGSGGEFGSGLYSFPEGSTLPTNGVIVIVRQAADAVGFAPDFEFLIDPLRDDPLVPNMEPAGNWEGFGFALGNNGDEVVLLKPAASGRTFEPVDVLVYGTGEFAGVLPHPGVSAAGHSLERRPTIYDTDDCSHDFFERYPPGPGRVEQE